MTFKCPGQDDRNLKTEILKCPDCGYKVEIFSDEIKVSCPKCKSLICRQRLPSCVDWCKFARECIGEEKWWQLKRECDIIQARGAAMQEIKVRLHETISRTSSVESFRFTPLEKIDFLPGQFLQVVFDEANRGNKELNKYLSFSSSPTREYIEVTKRLSQSLFSQKLRSLATNDQVLLKAPMGNCVFKEEYENIAFLIGGIGITPVISIIEYIAEKKLATDLLLFYSNRQEDDIAFKEELDCWQLLNNKIKVRYIVTECQPKDKSCIFGRIDKELLLKEGGDLRQRLVFIFGPPKMVEAMNALGLELGCKKENIKTENFIGY